MVAPGLVYATSGDDYARQFAKAQQLARQGKDTAASKIYEALIKQAPQQAQAYNNLAAIKARHGHLKQAQTLLEQALRSNPVYATVYQNLSAIYVEMARDSYGKALHLGTPRKNVSLRELTEPLAAPIQVASLAKADKGASSAGTVNAPSVHAPAASAPAVANTSESGATTKKPVMTGASIRTAAKTGKTPAQTNTRIVMPLAAKADTSMPPPPAVQPAPATQPPSGAVKTPVAAPAQVAESKPTPEPKKNPKLAANEPPPLLGPPIPPAAKTTTASEPVTDTSSAGFSKQAVISAMQGWAAAWSGKAVDMYLGFYAAHYAPHGMTHKQWVALRRQRLRAPKWIHVTLSDFQVKRIQDGVVRVRLIQEYKADTYHDLTRKEFRLRQTPDGWRIVEEKTLAKLP